MSQPSDRRTRRLLALEPDAPSPDVARPNRGRLLFVPDIVALLGTRKSPWWVRHRFAPASKIKIGRDVAWYERDAYSWLDTLRGKSA